MPNSQRHALRHAAAREGHRGNLPLSAAPIRDRHAEPPTSRGISDDKLAELVMALRDDDRLVSSTKRSKSDEPQIICSLGPRADGNYGTEMRHACEPRELFKNLIFARCSSRNSAGITTTARSKSHRSDATFP